MQQMQSAYAKHLRETLKPKAFGYFLKSKFSKVLLPEPDGPLSTTGRSVISISTQKVNYYTSPETYIIQVQSLLDKYIF